jgi:hypothetical protein
VIVRAIDLEVRLFAFELALFVTEDHVTEAQRDALDITAYCFLQILERRADIGNMTVTLVGPLNDYF